MQKHSDLFNQMIKQTLIYLQVTSQLQDDDALVQVMTEIEAAGGCCNMPEDVWDAIVARVRDYVDGQ